MAEADQLVAAAEGRMTGPFKIFENFIFYPPVMKAKELIDAGAIGDAAVDPHQEQPRPERDRLGGAGRRRRLAAGQAPCNGGGPLVFDDGHHKFALAWHFMGIAEEVHAWIGDTADGPRGIRSTRQSIVSFRSPATASAISRSSIRPTWS